MTLEAVPVRFRVDVACVHLASMLQDYDDYSCQESGCVEFEGSGSSVRVDLDVLIEKDLLRTEAGDTEGVTEEAVLAACELVSAVLLKLAVSKKVYA